MKHCANWIFQASRAVRGSILTAAEDSSWRVPATLNGTLHQHLFSFSFYQWQFSEPSQRCIDRAAVVCYSVLEPLRTRNTHEIVFFLHALAFSDVFVIPRQSVKFGIDCTSQHNKRERPMPFTKYCVCINSSNKESNYGGLPFALLQLDWYANLSSG